MAKTAFYNFASGAFITGGAGRIGGLTTIQTGGMLAPGDSIATLTFSNALILTDGSTNVFEMSASPLANDHVEVLGALTWGGVLVVTNIGANALAAGNTFNLFNAGSFSGSFSAQALPPLSNGLLWDATELATNGTLAVVLAPPPVINAVSVLGNGAFHLDFSGTSGQAYEIRATANLTLTPITSWTLLDSGPFSDAPVLFDDLQATNCTQRYYLICLP